jgi:cytochrome c
MMRHVMIALMLLISPTQADDALVAHGKVLAQENCATCHAIGVTGNSPLRDAPPFRDLAANYSQDELEDAFNDGVVTEHPAMPDWRMTPEQAAALSRYILSLSAQGAKKRDVKP